jgi:hypothetical protein
LAGARPAFADTVDASAKPFIVGFFALATLVFGAGGCFFIMRGRGTRRVAREAANWPTAEAKILATHVRTERRNPTGRAGAAYDVFIPEARYSYAVDGKHFDGTMIRPGMAQFGYAQKEAAALQLKPYAAGSTVPARYNPADPKIAMLEAAEYGGRRNIFAGILFAGLALAMLGGGVYFAALPTH